MAAPVVQSKGTAAAVATGTTVSPTRPASISANDIEILWVNSYTGGGANNTTFTDPSGWTRITATAYVNQFFANNGMMGLWWRRAAGGESGTVSVVRGGQTTHLYHGQLFLISGCVTTGNPYDAFTVFTGSGGAAITYSSVTASSPGSRTLLALAATVTNSAITLPSGYTTLVRDGTALDAGGSLEAFHLANVAAGSYSSSSAAGGGTEGSGSVHLAFAPVAAATSLIARSRGTAAHVLR
jgi:hypothetical protein